MLGQEKYIRFDWAAKKILRDKENFCILEGLISVLLKENVEIKEILESESNQDNPSDKFNRVDIKAKNSKGEIILVEIQVRREAYFLERILFGVAKAITEHLELGQRYSEVKKVYSINILYFDLGQGEDYIYKGQTTFKGLTKNDTLKISTQENDALRMRAPEEIFPEYYLIRVNAFNKIAENHLEEWIHYLKDGKIDENTTAPGLKEAKRKLDLITMSRKEQSAYFEHINEIMIQNDVMDTARIEAKLEGHAEGRAEGLAEGLAEGRAEGRAEGIEIGEKRKQFEIAANLKDLGMSVEQIITVTGLTQSEIENA